MHIFTHPACLKHTPGPDPAFAPQRLTSVMKALQADRFSALSWREAPPLATEDIYLAHTPDYVADVLRPIEAGTERAFDRETVAVSGTAEAALHAAGAVMGATAGVMAGEFGQAFCVVSPGGHHAEADLALGYCFFNHVALAAISAQKKMGAARVAVVDFDVHHGNGTQSLFWNYEDRLLISLHEENPLSGFARETGALENIVNIPLPRGSSGAFVRQAFREKVVPKLKSFRPDIFFVSAGFDMHRDDPLGSLALETEDYLWMGESLRESADALCGGRLVAVLEGGYNLDILGASVAAFVTGMMGKQDGC